MSIWKMTALGNTAMSGLFSLFNMSLFKIMLHGI